MQAHTHTDIAQIQPVSVKMLQLAYSYLESVKRNYKTRIRASSIFTILILMIMLLVNHKTASPYCLSIHSHVALYETVVVLLNRMTFDI